MSGCRSALGQLWGACTPAQRGALRTLVAEYANSGWPIRNFHPNRDSGIDPRTAKGLIRNHLAELRGDPSTSNLYPTKDGEDIVYTFWPELRLEKPGAQ